MKAAYQFSYFSLSSDTKYAHTEVIVLEDNATKAKKLADSLVEAKKYDRWRLDKVTDYQLLITRHEQLSFKGEVEVNDLKPSDSDAKKKGNSKSPKNQGGV